MEKENLYLDKSSIDSLLSFLEEMVLKKDKESIEKLDFLLYNIFININKEKLISKFIQLVGKDIFERYKISSVDEYYKFLPIVIQSGSLYYKETNDYLYLIAQLSIITDWVLYNKINLIIN